MNILLVNISNIGKMIISLVLGEKDMYVSTYHGCFDRENDDSSAGWTEIRALSGFLSRPWLRKPIDWRYLQYIFKAYFSGTVAPF